MCALPEVYELLPKIGIDFLRSGVDSFVEAWKSSKNI